MAVEQPYLPSGATVTVASEAMWRSMTTTDFAAYDLIVFGDKDCAGPQYTDLQAAYDTRLTWGAAINGRVVVHAVDPGCHGAMGGNPGANTYMKAALQWLSTGTGTALYVTGDWGRRNLDYLGGVGAFGSVAATGNDEHIVVPTHPTMIGSTDITLSNWGSSYHSAITAYPPSFQMVMASQLTSGGTTQMVARDVSCVP
jgi:hypothetical protein